VHTAARRLRQSPLAQLYFAAYQEVSGIPEVLDKVLDDVDEGLGPDRLEAVNRALRRASALEVARLEHYLPFLATTASATPFIGLFGTVWGIMAAFHGIGAQGSASLAVVAPGISEALVATAAGLGAAIPAVIGYNETSAGVEYMVASESVALEALGFRLLRDVAPGEAVFIDEDGKLHSQQCAERTSLNPCIFEYVYLARPGRVNQHRLRVLLVGVSDLVELSLAQGAGAPVRRAAVASDHQ
jgi:biopolymer transport protein ExbB/TolQ